MEYSLVHRFTFLSIYESMGYVWEGAVQTGGEGGYGTHQVSLVPK